MLTVRAQKDFIETQNSVVEDKLKLFWNRGKKNIKKKKKM